MSIDNLLSFFVISFILLIPPTGIFASTLQKLKKGIYAEDLALYRIQFRKSPKVEKQISASELAFPLDQTKPLKQRLAARKIAYGDLNSLKGYTIQLYMGSSRTRALQIQDLVTNFAYPPKLHYRQPHYTVQLGFFFDRLEAYFVYLTLVKKIPSAMVRPSMRTR